MSSLSELALDVLRFAMLVTLSITAGLGILRMLGITLSSTLAVFVAPFVALSFWAVFLGFGVALGAPVRVLTGPGWGFSIALALCGVVKNPRVPSRRDVASCTAVASLSLVVMAPYFLLGLARFPGSPLGDGWSYIAQGQYLWSYPNGSDGGLAPLYQYAAHLAHVRRIAASLLGFFSVLVRPGDTQSAANLFLSWVVFVFAASCTFFALSTALLTRTQLLTYVVLTVASGWIANLLWANNFDNGLALGFAPALAGLVAKFEPSSWRWHLLLGLCTASLFHVYPELAPLVVVLCVLVAAARWQWERTGVGTLLLAAGTSLGLALVLTWPFVPDLVWFVKNQASAGLQSGGRPGESMFPGLLSLRFYPSAFWALGGEYASGWWLAIGNITAVMMTVLAASGGFALVRSRHAGAIAWLVLLGCGAVSMIVVSRYAYGAYKLILLGWWALTFAVIVGTNVLRRFGPRTPALVCLILVAVATAQTTARQFRSVRIAGPWDLAAYRDVTTVARLSASKPTLIAVDDPVASAWAVYFLRDAPVALGRYRGYLSFPHVRPYLDRSRRIRPEEIGYVLTDQAPDRVLDDVRNWRTAWSSGPYRLLAPARRQWAVLTDIRNPYGLETVDGKPFFWMGSEPTVVSVLSGSAGVLTLGATFHPGPSAPSSPVRRIMLKTDSGHQHEALLTAGESKLVIHVGSGADRIVMTVLDHATAPAPNGDTRSLLLGVQDLRIGLGREEIVIRQVSNENGLERLDGRPFFWMGAGETTVTLEAARAGVVTLDADFVPGPGVSSTGERHVEVTFNGGERQLLTIPAGRQVLRGQVNRGENLVVLRPLDKPENTVTGAGDRRPLILGVTGLSAQLEDYTGPRVMIERIDNPNGVETVEGKQFLWIGGGPTVFHVRAERAGEMWLTGRVVLGPSVTGLPVRHLRVSNDDGFSRTMAIVGGDQVFRVPVPAGTSRILITPLDPPHLARQPNGDARPLIVGISAPAATLHAADSNRRGDAGR